MKEREQDPLEFVKEEAARSVSESDEAAFEYLESLGADPKKLGSQLAMRIRRENFSRLAKVKKDQHALREPSIEEQVERYARDIIACTTEELAGLLRGLSFSFQFRSLEDNGMSRDQMIAVLKDARRAEINDKNNIS